MTSPNDTQKNPDDVRVFIQVATLIIGGAVIVVPILWVFFAILFELLF